jgi:Ca2+-binding RTX toxin-like protein
MASNATGTAGNDVLNQAGDTGPGTIVGLAGDDCIFTGTGLATVTGDSGNDTVALQTGNHHLSAKSAVAAALSSLPPLRTQAGKGQGGTRRATLRLRRRHPATIYFTTVRRLFARIAPHFWQSGVAL